MFSSLNSPLSAFHHAGTGLIIIGPGKKILLMNKEAWSILTQGKHLSQTDFLKALPRAIYQAIIQEASGSDPIRRGVFQSGQRQYSVWTAPLFRPHRKSGTSTVEQKMVILERVLIKEPNIPLLMRKYKLTRREGHVVELLFNGKSDKLIGLSLGLSIETIRGHMRHIRSKFGATSRLEVVTLLRGI